MEKTALAAVTLLAGIWIIFTGITLYQKCGELNYRRQWK